MKNLTITLDEDLFSWARVEAAKQGQSLSRFVAQALADRRAPELAHQLAILEDFFEGPGWPGIAENLPTRDEIYDRSALLRHEHPDLRPGSEGSGEAVDEYGGDHEGSDAEASGRQPANSARMRLGRGL
ncbi:hypothetical protein [Methylobacterium sp. WL103]|uniref:hypothetical protein n=1 Tax=Methylobacterium sp. WL103 TaxID=2603891 RepID=UPI001FF05B3A|nr:hypothetical protein [Methylobacterium sp. WL103]